MPVIMSFKVLKYFSCGIITFFLFARLWQEDFKLRNFVFFFRNIDPFDNRFDRKMFVIQRKNIGLQLKIALFGSYRNVLMMLG